MRASLYDLVSNRAYTAIAPLAWNLKRSCAMTAICDVQHDAIYMAYMAVRIT